MELTDNDIGKYYLVYDRFETLGIETICRYMGKAEYAVYYPYLMFCIKGHWEGKYDTFSKTNIKRELTYEEAITKAL